MIFVGILLLLIGLVFCGLGYLIAFRGKYALINHFIEDRNNGKLDAAYARRTGMLEILWGLISILSGILVLAVRNPVFTWIALAIVVIGTAISLILNSLFSIKKK